jgi:hypothetical protein
MHRPQSKESLFCVFWDTQGLVVSVSALEQMIGGSNPTWTQSYDFDLQRQRCKFCNATGSLARLES